MATSVRGPLALLVLLSACDRKDPPTDTADSPAEHETGDPDSTPTGETAETAETADTGETGETGDSTVDTSPVDADADGFTSDLDCDDADATVYPGAPEICDDGALNDCDGAPGGDWDGCGISGLVGLGLADVRIDGTADSAFLATTLVVHDLDGDGLDDVLTSASNVNEGERSVGAVYYFRGASLSEVSGLIEASTADATVFGSTLSEQLGLALGAMPDLDGDDVAEVVIGAPAYADGMAYTGAAFVFSGTDLLATAAPYRSTDADLQLTAAHTLDYAGGAVLGQEDLDGDGRGELWVGSPYEGTGANVYQGTASLLRSKGALRGASGELSLADADLSIVGTTSYRYIGSVIADAGDLDGDGLKETWHSDAADPALDYVAGAAALFLGDTSQDASGVLSIEDADLKVVGDYSIAMVSYGLAGNADLDGDGRDDAIVSAPGGGTEDLYPGTMHALYSSGALAGGLSGTLSVSTSDVQIVGEDGGNELGAGVVIAGDVDVDGKLDLLVGSEHEICGALGGSAYLVLGGGSWPGTGSLDAADADAEICGTAGDRLVDRLAGPADINGDGADDLVIGSWSHIGSYDYGGEVAVFWGGGF